jgi:hypothetical protein
MVNEAQVRGDGWVEHNWPDLGISGRLPPFFHALPFREGDRRGCFLASDRDTPQEFVALARLPLPWREGSTEGWQAEGERLTTTPDWTGAIVGAPYPVEVDGTVGQQGTLWFRDPRGQELTGLLWVGRIGDDRVTVIYWCDARQSHHCGACYRRLLATIRWTPYDGQWNEQA